jgi:hypothetical protein
MLYERFVEECFGFGDGYLGKKGIPCFYGEGVSSFCIKIGCNDGCVITSRMNAEDEKAWLMVIRNEVVSGEYKHTRFLDEYFDNPKEMITRIKEQVLLHQGYDINYTSDFEE